MYQTNQKTTETCKNDCLHQKEEKAVNTDFTFQPKTKVQIVTPKESAVFSNEFSDTESDATIDNKSDQPYNPEETSESDYLYTV